MAYILGFIAADGSISKNQMCLSLIQREVDLLDQIQKALGSNQGYSLHPHVWKNGEHSVNSAVHFSSQKLVSDLANLGVYNNKSLTIRAPSIVEYPQDYVRGYFDGDGHGGIYKNNKSLHLQIGFTSGSLGFLQDIIKLLPVEMKGPYKGRGNSYSMKTAGYRNAEILRDWMYSGESPIHSKRKKAKLYMTKEEYLAAKAKLALL